MADIVFRRTGVINKNGSVAGELRIGSKIWPTIERGATYTFVRRGTYTNVVMCYKAGDSSRPCLCFNDSEAICSHLIHDAWSDNHLNLQGCIAPGLSADGNGIHESKKAMKEVLDALGGFVEWKKFTAEVQNNIMGDETREAWIHRREEAAVAH